MVFRIRISDDFIWAINPFLAGCWPTSAVRFIDVNSHIGTHFSVIDQEIIQRLMDVLIDYCGVVAPSASAHALNPPSR